MGKGLGREFLDFINRGNVVDLAVAVIIGAAFTKVVQAVVELFTTAALNQPWLSWALIRSAVGPQGTSW